MVFVPLAYSKVMAEQDENQKKPDQAEINKELFQQSAELKKKADETKKALEKLKEKAQELLHPDRDNPAQ